MKIEDLENKYLDKMKELNIKWNRELKNEQYELYGEETLSCWLENLARIQRKQEIE